MKEATITRARNAYSSDFYSMLTKECAKCDYELSPNDVVAIDGATIVCIACYGVAMNYKVREFAKLLKVLLGCEDTNCEGYRKHYMCLDYAHLDASTKRKTKSGKPIHPSDLFISCSWKAFRHEVMLCATWCKSCHTYATAMERGL